MRTEFLCISVLRVATGPRVTLASCKSPLNPPVVYYTDRSKAVVPVLVLLFVALWFILRGDLFYGFPCVILFLCFSVLLVLRLPRLGKRELILVLSVRLFDFCLFGFVGFLWKGCGLWMWHSLDFSLTFFVFVWFCLFALPLSVWDRLRLVIVVLPGLFFITFFVSKGNVFIFFTTIPDHCLPFHLFSSLVLTGIKCRVVAVKDLFVLHRSKDFLFILIFLWITEPTLVFLNIEFRISRFLCA